MKPIILELQAFGPYGDRQRIDFREALDAGLFGIYGPTGSGKSSIFSAITFALFGEAAKKEQPIASLRSAHAAPESMTHVALVFEVGANRYLIKRQPDQLRPKTRGAGDTASAHAAWLFDVTALDLDAIDLDGCGTVLAERRVSTVNELVRTILGYGAEQFRQIVLLPQGRFEHFLTANSNERLAILRELFDVSLYRKLTERLKEHAAEARREVSDGYRIHGQRLHAEGFASADELATAIAARAEQSSSTAVLAQVADQALASAEQAVSRALAIEAQFIAREEAAQSLEALRGQETGMASRRAQRDHALLAQRASDRFDAIASAAAREDQARADADHAAQALRHSENQLATAQATLAAASEAAQAIEPLQQEAFRLERFEQVLRDAQDLEIAAQAAAYRLAQCERDADAALETRQQYDAAREAAETKLSTARQRAVTRAELAERRAGLAASLQNARPHHRATAELAAARTRLQQAARDEQQASEAHAIALRQSEQAETQFIAAQASLLALRLAEGEPCSVCGASEHPAPAHGTGDPRALETLWKTARQATGQTEQARSAAAIAAAQLASLVAERETQLAAIEAPRDALATLEAQQGALHDALAQLGPAEDLDTLAGDCARLAQASTQAKDAAQQCDVERQAARTQAALAARAYDDQIAHIPEAMRDAAELGRARAQVVSGIEQRKNALAQAQAALSQASTHCATCKAASEAVARAQQGCATQHAAAKRLFAERVAEIGLAADDYPRFAQDIPKIAALTEQLTVHERALRQAEGALTQATAQLEGIERPALGELRETRETAQAAALEARQSAAAASESHRSLVRLEQALATELTRLAALEQ